MRKTHMNDPFHGLSKGKVCGSIRVHKAKSTQKALKRKAAYKYVKSRRKSWG